MAATITLPTIVSSARFFTRWRGEEYHLTINIYKAPGGGYTFGSNLQGGDVVKPTIAEAQQAAVTEMGKDQWYQEESWQKEG